MPFDDLVTRRNFISAFATVPAVLTIGLPQQLPATPGRVEDARNSDEEAKNAELVTFVATFNPKQGQETAVEEILRGMTAPSRREPGVLRYDLYRTTGTPTAFVLFEIYRDQTAHEAHRATAYYKGFRSAVADLLSANQAMSLQGLDVVR
jgi:quinol monooxygenase YgiN